MIDCILKNNEIIFDIITVLLIIIGWFAVFWFGLRQQKNLLKNSAKMKVYEELYELKKIIDEEGQNLSLLYNFFSIPFLDMKYAGDKSKAFKFWTQYLENLSKRIYTFTGAYLKLWVHTEMWIGVMPELKKAQKELFVVQLNKLLKDLYNHHGYLQNLSINNYNWEEWGQEDIKKRSEEISKEFDQIAVAFLDDFMVEVYNSLLSSILGYKKKPRENFNKTPQKYKILTKDGIKEIES